jgi:hypothetical protein
MMRRICYATCAGLLITSVLHAQQPAARASQGDATATLSKDAWSSLPISLKTKVVRQVEQPDRSLLLFFDGLDERDLPQLTNIVRPLPSRGWQPGRVNCPQCDDSGLREHNVLPVHSGIYGPRWPINFITRPSVQPPRKLRGTGITIAFVDIGAIDSEHIEFQDNTAQGSVSRVTPATPRDQADAHATADAGTAAAAGVNARARGAAPAAGILGVQNSIPAQYWSDVEAIADRAPISSHSTTRPAGWNGQRWWGIVGQPADTIFGQYGPDAFSADDLVVKHPAHLMFVAAGNDRADGLPDWVQPVEHYHQVADGDSLHWERGMDKHPRDGSDGGFHTVLGGCVAKNVICVGAVFDLNQMSQAEVTDFSNFGPTLDGRLKPDVVANGFDVLTLSVNANSPYEERVSGTSQATPMAAGIAALVEEAFRVFANQPTPPAALVKAVLLHTARPHDAQGPNPAYGWGLLDATAAVELLQDSTNTVKMLDVSTDGPTTIRFRRDSPIPFRVTVVWTDPPALATTEAAPTLMNDVDAVLASPTGENVLPWELADAKPYVARRAANHKDNVEIIDVLDNAASGVWTLTLRAHQFRTGTTQSVAIIVPGVLDQ